MWCEMVCLACIVAFVYEGGQDCIALAPGTRPRGRLIDVPLEDRRTGESCHVCRHGPKARMRISGAARIPGFESRMPAETIA